MWVRCNKRPMCSARGRLLGEQPLPTRIPQAHRFHSCSSGYPIRKTQHLTHRRASPLARRFFFYPRSRKVPDKFRSVHQLSVSHEAHEERSLQKSFPFDLSRQLFNAKDAEGSQRNAEIYEFFSANLCVLCVKNQPAFLRRGGFCRGL